mgnify:CR=1 FL=1
MTKAISTTKLIGLMKSNWFSGTNKRINRKGFTLVELLASIAIFSILTIPIYRIYDTFHIHTKTIRANQRYMIEVSNLKDYLDKLAGDSNNISIEDNAGTWKITYEQEDYSHILYLENDKIKLENPDGTTLYLSTIFLTSDNSYEFRFSEETTPDSHLLGIIEIVNSNNNNFLIAIKKPFSQLYNYVTEP